MGFIGHNHTVERFGRKRRSRGTELQYGSETLDEIGPVGALVESVDADVKQGHL